MGILDRIRGYSNEPSVGEDGAPTYTVTTLGGTHSGKTVYMHALFQFLKHGILRQASHDIMSDIAIEKWDSIEKLTWDSIMRQNKGALVLPLGTSETEEWSFSWMHKGRRICNLDWVDYRGGIMDNLESDDEETNFLRELLACSDGLILFVNSTSLFYFEDDADKRQLSGITDLEKILRSIISFTKCNPHSPFSEEKPDRRGISIVLAKADSDLLDDSLAKPGLLTENSVAQTQYAGLIKAYMQQAKGLNEALMDASKGVMEWKSAIMPVGAFGHGRTKTTLKPIKPGGSLEDCVYSPEGDGKASMPAGNKLKQYFDAYCPPGQEVEYIPLGRGNLFPRPVNAFAPVLWLLDKFLENSHSQGLTRNQSELFKGMIDSFYSQLLENDKSPEVEEPTATNAVKPIIAPLDSIYKP